MIYDYALSWTNKFNI